MTDHDDTEIRFQWASEIDCTPPTYPRVVKYKGEWWLEATEGRDYKLPDDPFKVLGLLHHLTQKRCVGDVLVDASYVRLVIERIAAALGWQIHPF
jgi:hypothetical protein